MDDQEIIDRLSQALSELLARDRILLELDVLERCVCGRLGIYVDALFSEYNVDLEYNRHALDPKRLDFSAGCREGTAMLVIPDLIVHERTTDDRNLLVVEVKLKSNNEPRECDLEKLAGFLEDYGYQLGVLVDLPVKDEAGEWPDLTWLSVEEGRAVALEMT